MARPDRAVYGEVLLGGFVPTCALLAVGFAGVAVWHVPALGPVDGLVMGTVAGVTAALFAGAAVLARRGPVTARRAHPVAAALVGVVLINCAVHYVLTEQAFLSVNALLMVIGAGLCLVDRTWTAAVVASCGLAWPGVVGLVTGPGAAAQALLVVGLGCVVAGLANVVRLSTLHRLLETQEELRALSQRDELTGLLNRRGFLQAAQVLLDRRRPVRLWFLDVDGLKAVNDRQGHDVGDVLLISVAAALQDVFAGGVVARLAGDEFAVLEDHGSVCGLARAQQALDARLALASQTTGLRVRVSTGTATAEPGSSLSELLTAADAAMYAAKAERRTVRLPVPVPRAPTTPSAPVRVLQLSPPLFD